MRGMEMEIQLSITGIQGLKPKASYPESRLGMRDDLVFQGETTWLSHLKLQSNLVHCDNFSTRC